MALYSDLNQRTPTKQPLVEDFNAVIQSLRNVFLTKKRERLFRPNYGLRANLWYELMSEQDSKDFYFMLNREVPVQEGRVRFDQSSRISFDSDSNTLDLSIFVKVYSLGQTAYNAVIVF